MVMSKASVARAFPDAGVLHVSVIPAVEAQAAE
jgi:hypothetical protein